MKFLAIAAAVMLASVTASSASTYDYDGGSLLSESKQGGKYKGSLSGKKSAKKKKKKNKKNGEIKFTDGKPCMMMYQYCGEKPAETPNEVPLPASGLLLLGGAGVLAGVRRKKKA